MTCLVNYWLQSFAFDINNTFWTYISSNPNAHCGDVVNYLIVGIVILLINVLIGKCNMLMKSADWEGSVSLENDPVAVVATAIECAMDEGEFSLMNLDGNSKTIIGLESGGKVHLENTDLILRATVTAIYIGY